LDAEGLFDEVEVGFMHDEVLGGGFRRCFGGGVGGFLQTEANFVVFPLFLGFYELGVSAVEGAVGGGVVANEESEVLGDAELLVLEEVEEGVAPEVEGPLGEPLGLGHFFDEDFLGGGDGVVFRSEVGEKCEEFFLVF